MTSDLFHDAARAYYGVGPEVYTLANIATCGNAPPKYALGDDAPVAPDQYAVKPMKDQPSLFNKMTEPAPSPAVSEPSVAQKPPATATPAINRKSLQKYNPLAGDLFRAAELLSKKGLHKDAAQAHSGLARYFGALAKNTDDLEAARFAKYHSDQADFHAGQPAPSGTKGYVKPTFAQPETIPDTPEQKHFEYALGDSNTGSVDDDPMMKRKGASGMYPAQPRPMSSFGTRITLAGDYPSKPDYSETGTGDHVTADKEDYGIMDAAKKAALGAGIAMSAMGGGCAKPESASPPAATADSSGFTDSAQNNVQTRLRHARHNVARMKARQATGGGPGVGVSVQAPKIDYSLTGTGTVLPPPPLPKPRYPATKTLQKLGKSPPPPPPSAAERKRQESAGQQIAAEKKGGFAGQFNYSLPDEEIDYSLTGTGDRFDDKYAAAAPPPPPPPPGKGTYGDLAKAAKQLQGTGIHLRDLLPSETTAAPTQASPTPAATKPATSKPRIPEELRMAAQRIQQRHNSQQKVPPSNKPWS